MAHRQKPATAAWIQRERKRLGLSTRELSERLALIGAKVGEQTISVWESYAGRNPSSDNLDALERIFGSQAPEKPAAGEPTAGLAALVEALTAHTRAMVDLTEELRRDRLGRANLEPAVAELRDYAARHELQRQLDLEQIRGLVSGERAEDPADEADPSVALRP